MRVPHGIFQVCLYCVTSSRSHLLTSAVNPSCVSAGYDVQSASTRDGVLYISGAPRYNHTGRVVIYRLNRKNNIVVSQILKGEQVGLLRFLFLFQTYCDAFGLFQYLEDRAAYWKGVQNTVYYHKLQSEQWPKTSTVDPACHTYFIISCIPFVHLNSIRCPSFLFYAIKVILDHMKSQRQ